jgi:hypothetical protein
MDYEKIEDFSKIPFETLIDLVYKRIQSQSGKITITAPQSSYDGHNFNPVYYVEIYIKYSYGSEHYFRGNGRFLPEAFIAAVKQLCMLPHMSIIVPKYML